MKIVDKNIGNGEPTFIMVDAGINHCGSLSIAKKMIEEASNCNCDAVKFQTHLPESEMIRSNVTASYVKKDLFTLLKEVELSKSDHFELRDCAKDNNIIFLSTPFCIKAVDLLEEINVPAYKVGSGEMLNFPLIKRISETKKPVIISTGMSLIEEVKKLITYADERLNDYSLLYCVSTYPTPYKDLNINVIQKLKQISNRPVGFSDHSVGIHSSLAAVALGANIIEKHFTISKKLPGPDQRASINTKQLKNLVTQIRDIESSLGTEKIITTEEKEVRDMAYESVTMNKSVNKGETLTSGMVSFKRPGTGILPCDLQCVLGMKIIRI